MVSLTEVKNLYNKICKLEEKLAKTKGKEAEEIALKLDKIRSDYICKLIQLDEQQYNKFIKWILKT